jgi:hypothetical protein
MRYEETVRRFCGEDWKTVNKEEKEGGIGVAMVLGLIRANVKPTIGDFSAHLGVPADDIVVPFNRLQRAGVFTTRFNVKKDDMLNGHPSDSETQWAWGQIAGISGGLTGV